MNPYKNGCSFGEGCCIFSYLDQRITNDSHVCLPDQMEMTKHCRGHHLYNFYEVKHYFYLNYNACKKTCIWQEKCKYKMDAYKKSLKISKG
jgi:hypothetical protein